MQTLSVAVRNFNDRVKLMNQTGSKQLIMTADEARNLHADIYSLMNIIAEMQNKTGQTEQVNQISMDGGRF